MLDRRRSANLGRTVRTQKSQLGLRFEVTGADPSIAQKTADLGPHNLHVVLLLQTIELLAVGHIHQRDLARKFAP